MQMTAPQSVSQNIARAKSLIQRHELPRALDCLLSALDNFEPGSLIGKARFEVEVNIRQCVAEINLNPQIRGLLTEFTHSSKSNIPYTPGEEAALRSVLGVLRKALENMEIAEKQGAQQALKQRKADLIENGQSLLAKGEGVKAKVELRKLAEEFGKEPGVYAQIGNMFVGANLPVDAAEFLELAIENFPKEGQVYGTLVDCYMGVKEYEKAEAVYLKALKNFGSHPRTLVNLAKVYKLLNKRTKAVEAAQSALTMEPGNAEAKAIVDSIR
jgi:pentatricopeptide repeat protein